MIPAKTPLPLQRFQRLLRAFVRPYSFGASCHRNPLRFTKIMPLKNATIIDMRLAMDFGARKVSGAPSGRRSASKDCLSLPALRHARSQQSMGLEPRGAGERCAKHFHSSSDFKSRAKLVPLANTTLSHPQILMWTSFINTALQA